MTRQFILFFSFVLTMNCLAQVILEPLTNPVLLTDNALAGMSVRIVPVINAVSPIEQGIAEGSSSVTVGTASLPAGQYVLCLMHEGNVVQSVNIIKVAQ